MRLVLFAVAVFSVASAGPDAAQAGPKVVGTWRLVAASSSAPGGEIDNNPYGSAPTGFLTYTADRRVTAIITHGGRKPLSIPDRIAAPPEERATAFASLIAYAGRYQISGDTVIHHVEAASVQNWVGTDLVRTVGFRGDQMTLRTPPTSLGGQVKTFDLVWERVK